jgi:hypothetical protein
MFLINAFSPPERAGNAWFNVGTATSYPNIEDTSRIGEHRPCEGTTIPGCRIFHVPRNDSARAREIAIDDWKDAEAGDAKDQVMVFQYKGSFLALNHVSKHRLRLLVLSVLTGGILGVSTLILPTFERHTFRH